MEQIIRVLESTLNADKNIRDQATATLEQAKSQSYGQLLGTLTSLLANQGVSQIARHAAAMFVKNMVSGHSRLTNQQAQTRWNQLDNQTREHVKACLMNALVAKEPPVRRAVSQCIGKIASVELPANRWPKLLQDLCSACMSPQETLRETALETLGYICEEVNAEALGANLNNVLSVIVGNVTQQTNSATTHKAALGALQMMLPMLGHIFRSPTPNDRDYFMQALLQSVVSPSPEVQKTALEVLSTVLEEHYPYIMRYMETVYKLTVPMIQECSKDPEVVMQAIEVWITLGETEQHRAELEQDYLRQGAVVPDDVKSQRYVVGAQEALVQALYTPLTRQEEDQEEDAWDLSHAAATCLSVVAECTGGKIAPIVVDQYVKCVGNSNWHVREAVMVALGSIAESVPKADLAPVLAQPNVFGVLIQSIDDASPQVRQTAAWTLGRLCMSHIEALIGPDGSRYNTILQAFAGHLKAEPRLVTACVWGIGCLADAISDFVSERSIANPLMANLADLISTLYAQADAPTCTPRLRRGAYQTIVTLVRSSTSDCTPVIEQVLLVALSRVEALVSGRYSLTAKELDEVGAHMASVISECLPKIGSRAAQIGDRILNDYIQLYRKGTGAAAQEEAIFGIGTFASAVNDGTNPIPAAKLSDYLAAIYPILLECIKKPDEVDVCKAAIGAMGDIAGLAGPIFAQALPDVMGALVSIIQNSAVEPNIYPHVFGAFGDIAQAVGGSIEPFVDGLANICHQAMLTQVDMTDEDKVDYICELQYNSLTCISSLTSTLSSSGKFEPLQRNIGVITDSVYLSMKNTKRTPDLDKAIIACISDLFCAAGKSTAQLVQPNAPWEKFPQVITVIMNSTTDPSVHEECQSVNHQLQACLGTC